MNTIELILDRDGRPFTDSVVAEQVAAVLSRETGEQFAVTSHDGGYGLARQPRATADATRQGEMNDSDFKERWLRPSWRSQLSKVFAIALGSLLFAFSDQLLILLQVDRLVVVAGDILKISASDIFSLVSAGVSVVGLLIAVVAIIRALLFIYSHHYYIGPWGIEANTELVAKDQRRIEYKHIRGVNLRQSILERLLGIGALDIATSGAAESEVQFLGVSNPKKLLEILRERLRVMA